MKFLIAGLGSIGRRHLKHLEALGQRDIVLYRSHKGTLPEEGLESYPVETDLEKALAHQPDAVIISNPTALHLEVAIPAAKAGCALFIEKPVSHSMAGLDTLQKLVNAQQLKVLVGFQFRYHPGLQQAHKMLKEGAIGRPISFRAHWGEYLPGWHPWEDYRKGYSARADLGGGVVLTLTHPFDYARMLFGEVQVLAAISGSLGKLALKVEDTAEVVLKFNNNVVGSIHLNYNQRPPQHTLEIVGTEGSIRFDQAKEALELYTSNHEQWQALPLPQGFNRDSLFRSQMSHFIEVLEGKATPVCRLEDGLAAQAIASAVHLAASTGTWVMPECQGLEKGEK